MRNNILKYKRYIAQLEFDLEESIIIGKVTFPSKKSLPTSFPKTDSSEL